VRVESDAKRRWTLGSPIAFGGMGEVREAYDRLLQRDIALKVVRSDLQSSHRDAQDFLEEARITAGLDHPGVVPVHDLLLRDGRLTLVMKRVRGETLTDVFRPLQRLPLRETDVRRVCQILVRACETVSFAHSHGIIHCDLKPDNVMVGTHGEVYVMDWGVAHVHAKTPDGISVPLRPGHAGEKKRFKGGTIAYMAPEQAASRYGAISERTDVHGFGGILHHFLCGKAPYSGENLASVRDRPSNGVGASIANNCIWIDAPPGLIEIATRALAPDPDSRHASVAEFRDDLERFLDGGGWFASASYLPGETIVEENAPGDSAYILVSGRCGVYKGHGSERVLLRRLLPGDVFGETAVVAHEPAPATVVSETEVTVKIVTRESLQRELARNPWMATFTLTLATRFLELDRRPDGSHRRP